MNLKLYKYHIIYANNRKKTPAFYFSPLLQLKK